MKNGGAGSDMAAGGRARRRVRIALFVALNAAAIGVTAFFDFRSDGSGVSREDLAGMDARYLLPAFACFAVALLAESLKFRMALGGMPGGRVPFLLAFKLAVIGKYYDNITPFGAGGQPFQVNYLLKRGYPAGEATATVVSGFLAGQLAFILISIPVFIFGSGVVDTAALFAPAALGLLFYMFVPAAVILFVISPPLAVKALGALLSAGGKLRIVKEPGALRKRALDALTSSRSAILSLTRDGTLTSGVFLLSGAYQLAMCSMPFFVLRVFGGEVGYISAFCTCVFIYLCITFIPTPGNSGVAEGSFYAFFSAFGQEHLFWVMLVWRFFCYYMFILTGLSVLALDAAGGKKQTKGA
jgi:uncharacterized protein (TIRG00374 family)